MAFFLFGEHIGYRRIQKPSQRWFVTITKQGGSASSERIGWRYGGRYGGLSCAGFDGQ